MAPGRPARRGRNREPDLRHRRRHAAAAPAAADGGDAVEPESRDGQRRARPRAPVAHAPGTGGAHRLRARLGHRDAGLGSPTGCGGRCGWPRRRTGTGDPAVSPRGDTAQVGVTMLSLVVGRRLRDDEFPERLEVLVGSARQRTPIGRGRAAVRRLAHLADAGPCSSTPAASRRCSTPAAPSSSCWPPRPRSSRSRWSSIWR